MQRARHVAQLITLWLCILSFIPSPADASGLLTHSWVADRLIEDISDDCLVSLGTVSAKVPQDVCDSIRTNPEAFRAGMLGPDVYPDLVTGQVTTHPGIAGDWQTADWLRRLYTNATSGDRLAFAAGYVTHASVDTFAHSYVNMYSGDIFNLKGERRVELRHFTLEKYIDYRLPSGTNSEAISPPIDFLVEELLYSDNAERLAGKSGSAPHIVGMNVVRRSVNEADNSLRKLDNVAGKVLAEVIAAYLGLTRDIVTNQLQLKIAIEALGIEETRLEVERKALERLHDELQKSVDSIEDVESDIRKAGQDILDADKRISEGRSALQNANTTIATLELQVLGLKRQLDNLHETIPENICNSVCKMVKKCVLGVCVKTKVCAINACYFHDVIKQVSNPIWRQVNKSINDTAGQIITAKSKLHEAEINLAADAAKKAQALHEKVAAQEAKLRYDALRTSLQASYDLQKTKYDIQLSLTSRLKNEAVTLREKLDELGKSVIKVADVKKAIEGFITDLKLVSFYTNNWRNGIDKAGVEYIKTSTKVAKLTASGKPGAFTEIRRWVGCYGSAFTPVPYQAAEFGCNVESEYARVRKKLDDLVLKVLPAPFDKLYTEYINVKADVDIKIKNATDKAGREVIKLAAPDGTTARLIDLLSEPQRATKDRLNSEFKSTSDSGATQLLSFPRVSDMIDIDLHLENDKLDPLAFRSLRHSLTLAKLSLLDFEEVRKIVWTLGANVKELPLPSHNGRYSLMIESVRSIDGNHQWQPFGLPYPRVAGVQPEPTEASKRQFGYGAQGDGPKGMPLFRTESLRQNVFNVLFPGGVAGEIRNRDELKSPVYPFQECDRNPFPVAFSPDGSDLSKDIRCQLAISREGPTPSAGWKRFWRSIGRVFGLKPPPFGPATAVLPK